MVIDTVDGKDNQEEETMEVNVCIISVRVIGLSLLPTGVHCLLLHLDGVINLCVVTHIENFKVQNLTYHVINVMLYFYKYGEIFMFHCFHLYIT